jgi:nucleoside-diphosphate-sugar epimerase
MYSCYREIADCCMSSGCADCTASLQEHCVSSSPPRVLIVGAAGRFGRCAISAFAAAGWHVIAQARSGAVPAGARITATTTDVTDGATLAREAHGARAVVHAINPPLTQWRQDALPLLEGSITVARRTGATLMLPGNVYAFGEAMPAQLHIGTPVRPSTRKGAIRQAMEARLVAGAADGLDSVVVRGGDFFGGSGRGNWFDEAIVKSIAHGKLVYPGPLDRAHAWAYLPDFAQAFVALASQPRGPATARRFHFAGHTVDGAQLLSALEAAAQQVGIEPARGWRHAGLPWPLIRAVGVVVPAWRELAEMAYLWRVPHALDGRALHDAVGPLPHTPLVEALAASLQALGVGRAPAALSLQP